MVQLTYMTGTDCLRVYNQAPKPILVVAIGACGCTGGYFTESYTFAGPVDKIIPVNAYVPGCPPKPEAIIAGNCEAGE